MPAFLRSTFAEFVTIGMAQGLHQLTSGLAAQGFDLTPEQHAAWIEEWPYLETALSDLIGSMPNARDWTVLLEYPIPGRRKRIDAVLLTDKGIIVLEFKHSGAVTAAAKWQVREYCWNLRDFHMESRGADIAPVVCLIESSSELRDSALKFRDRHGVVLDVEICTSNGLADGIRNTYRHLRNSWKHDPANWDNSIIEPTLSVIEFAQRLFGGHDVREISHAHSDNTDVAVEELRSAIEEAQQKRKRIICFVTGVPGAGKTLVGLNAAYRKQMIETAGGPVCFASGNQPLLDVIKAALVLNRTRRGQHRLEVAHDISAPVQNIHEFARDTLSRSDEAPPAFHVVVFDEAQRVWSAEKLGAGLEKRRRRGQLSKHQVERILTYGRSEPELLLSLMERWKDWCVIIALVGGGQEIHDGEAGLAEWGRVLANRDEKWTVWVSSEAARGGISSASQKLFALPPPADLPIVLKDALHLSISKRSVRAERYAEWVNCVVGGNVTAAKEVSKSLAEFPVLLTRDIVSAREAIRSHCPTELRAGLLASSGALRLRAEGIEVSADFRNGINFPDWFLRPAGDIRSSSQLEVAATEFECQGLELDWCGVCWGGDFVMIPNHKEWCFRKLRAPSGRTPQWYAELSPETCEFIRNKYRVLLTRARVGVVIFIPPGSSGDKTRERTMFDCTADFLVQCGALVF